MPLPGPIPPLGADPNVSSHRQSSADDAAIFDAIKYENDQASKRFQNLMILNALWLVAYVEVFGLPGAVKTDPISAGAAWARTALCALGSVSTGCTTVALWYGLRHIDGYWVDARKQVGFWMKVCARAPYYVMPPLLVLFWAYLGETLNVGTLNMATMLVVTILGWVLPLLVVRVKVDDHMHPGTVLTPSPQEASE